MQHYLGENLGDRSSVHSHNPSLVDASSSLLCQLHSHQQKHRLENQQNYDFNSPLESFKAEDDRTNLFDDKVTKKLSAFEMQVITVC